MKNLVEGRRVIDAIDEQILILLIKRARIVESIGEIKDHTRIADPTRENEILRKVYSISPPDLQELLTVVYANIIHHFREHERKTVSSDVPELGE